MRLMGLRRMSKHAQRIRPWKDYFRVIIAIKKRSRFTIKNGTEKNELSFSRFCERSNRKIGTRKDKIMVNNTLSIYIILLPIMIKLNNLLCFIIGKWV
jgi:hypothetical protein